MSGFQPEPERKPQEQLERAVVRDKSAAVSSLRLSIIIVNWNTKDLLKACLASLNNESTVGSSEIIVVDNGSSDDSVAMVRRDFPDVKLIGLERNLGFSAGNNVGLRQASGDYLLLLN